ncbi:MULTISPECIES: hypothetical protein [Bacillus]|nr:MULTISPECIES: hypothetical protein [Bacillus]MCC2528323.1 hypothetical protein [Bacillus halotolerans]MCK8100467.1 hypothetical protein [Bacillus sp. 2CMS4F]MDP4526535.1 hypothetical protein [Bacillus halotolerans]MEC1606951.1 hypothetical protein [Bacillus halotolerans]
MFQREIFIKQKRQKRQNAKPSSFLLFYWTRSEGFAPPADVVPETIQMLL